MKMLLLASLMSLSSMALGTSVSCDIISYRVNKEDPIFLVKGSLMAMTVPVLKDLSGPFLEKTVAGKNMAMIGVITKFVGGVGIHFNTADAGQLTHASKIFGMSHDGTELVEITNQAQIIRKVYYKLKEAGIVVPQNGLYPGNLFELREIIQQGLDKNVLADGDLVLDIIGECWLLSE